VNEIINKVNQFYFRENLKISANIVVVIEALQRKIQKAQFCCQCLYTRVFDEKKGSLKTSVG
jgi:hypothetical protein